MRSAEYAAAVKHWQANRRAALAEVFMPGMTVSEAADALAMALGTSFSIATVRNDLLELGLTPANGTERRRVATKSRREEVRARVLAGESPRAIAQQLHVAVDRVKADIQALVAEGELPAEMIARAFAMRQIDALARYITALGPDAQAAYEKLRRAVFSH